MSTPQSPSSKPESGAPEGGAEKGYRATLNLPKTSFAMKANLVQNEPASVKRWAAMDLYGRIRSARAGRAKYLFHDGPPYANGSIHLGHVLNKTLKDFVVRTRTMMGMDCPYVPGWDCHGLPIEHKVMTELVESGKAAKLATLTDEQRRMAVRRECQKYAEKYQKLQSGQFQRIMTLADYSRPYLTMSPEFEGATLEVLAALLEQGLVYRALKPVHWSIANETALAEAELEYYDREDASVYVDFEAEDGAAVYEAFGLEEVTTETTEGTEEEEEDEAGGEDAEAGERSRVPEAGVRPGVRPSLMIWTTTPWTLPANLAIAVNPKFTYALVWVDGNVTVLASDAVERVCKGAKAEAWRVLATAPGTKLVGLRYRHPFVDPGQGEGVGAAGGTMGQVFRVVGAEYVTLEDGTGLVHTAPGHGEEDYMTGQREGLPVYCPVLGNGTYDQTVPAWLRGVDIWQANGQIVRRLRESGHLFFDHTFTHSYPHDWRSKTPVIFRCTEQWFVGVDRPAARDGAMLRARGLEATDEVKFVPAWGRNRLRGMLESRPDWCISRQRSWGLPIPAFFLPDGSAFMTAASVRAVAKAVREKGSDAWFTLGPADLLRHYDAGADRECPEHVGRVLREAPASVTRGPDIIDVWFESGSTWNGVMRERSGGRDFPVDLYLEGADQHRGWFQSSLLCALGVTGKAPYRTLLTHGFTVNKEGRKLSKSKGDTIEDLFNDFGVDVIRWWVSSLSYENDMKVDQSFFELAGESYRKIRNTLRFMLSNLDDFSPQSGAAVPAPATLDAWVLGEFDLLRARVVAAYGAFDFQGAHQAMYNFCNDTLSAVYLAAIKDRMYCDKAASARRRRTQATLWTMADGLTRLLAPVLCHTADEAHRALWKSAANDAERCVHVLEFPGPTGATPDDGWARVFEVRGVALGALEKGKAQGVENPLDAGVVLPDKDGTLARFDRADLADLLGVSRVELDAAGAEVRILDLRNEPRCDRSWKRDGTVKRRSDGGMLSDRDAEAVGVS